MKFQSKSIHGQNWWALQNLNGGEVQEIVEKNMQS